MHFPDQSSNVLYRAFFLGGSSSKGNVAVAHSSSTPGNGNAVELWSHAGAANSNAKDGGPEPEREAMVEVGHAYESMLSELLIAGTVSTEREMLCRSAASLYDDTVRERLESGGRSAMSDGCG